MVKDRENDHGHGRNSYKDIMGKSYMAQKNEKNKERKK